MRYDDIIRNGLDRIFLPTLYLRRLYTSWGAGVGGGISLTAGTGFTFMLESESEGESRLVSSGLLLLVVRTS